MTTGRVGTFLRDHWAAPPRGWHRAGLNCLLASAEVPFRIATGLRNGWYDRRSGQKAGLPVVSVGNLTVGGTGKTPVVRWLATWLRVQGVNPAVVLRGYGHDEVELLRRWIGNDRVYVDRDRARGIRQAQASGYDAVLLDDGFQHRQLGRSLDILLVAAEDPSSVRLLPRGPYREPLAQAKRATHILVTRRTASREVAEHWMSRLRRIVRHVPIHQIQMYMDDWCNLEGATVAAPTHDVLAVCGIARPDSFATGLRRVLHGRSVELMAYPDHHAYTDGDVARILGRRGGRPIVCTTKDATKLRFFSSLTAHCVAVDLRVAGEPAPSLASTLRRAIGVPCASR